MHLYIIVHKVDQFIYLSFILFWKVYVCTKSDAFFLMMQFDTVSFDTSTT